VLSGGPPVRRALRQLGIGFGAAGVTYALKNVLTRGSGYKPLQERTAAETSASVC